jgi:hypothetical protein
VAALAAELAAGRAVAVPARVVAKDLPPQAAKAHQALAAAVREQPLKWVSQTGWSGR